MLTLASEESMKQDKTNSKDKPHLLRKKMKRIEESRNASQAKNREKAKVIKAYQDRETELKNNRDSWKAKCKEKENENKDLKEKITLITSTLEITEEQLQQVRYEFNEVKKKII